MPTKRAALTVREVAALIREGRPGATSDGQGLSLRVAAPGVARWTLRYQRGGKAREMGLGGVGVKGDKLTGTGLAEARDAAEQARALLKQGRDPIEAAREAPPEVVTFRAVMEDVLADRVSANRNAKHRAQWRSTLETYAAPLLDKDVAAISTDDVLGCLRPIWSTKPETASRTRQRIEAVIAAAKARGFRQAENPATWRGHLAGLLPPPRRAGGVRHHPALPWSQVPGFLAELRQRPATAARALEFTILTAVRTGEVRGARWGEIDLDVGVWTVPAARMKAKRPHRVPLSEPAVALLRAMKRKESGPADYVFRGERPGKPLSEMSLLMLLRRMNPPESKEPGALPCWRDAAGHAITTHGFRSSFRDWASDTTSFPDRVVEAALAHTVKDQVEAAYRRGDLFEARKPLMAAWATFCAGQPAADVVTLKPRKARA